MFRTTCSPAVSPLVTWVSPPEVSPVVTSRVTWRPCTITCTVLFPPGPGVIAAAGTASTFASWW